MEEISKWNWTISKLGFQTCLWPQKWKQTAPRWWRKGMPCFCDEISPYLWRFLKPQVVWNNVGMLDWISSPWMKWNQPQEGEKVINPKCISPHGLIKDQAKDKHIRKGAGLWQLKPRREDSPYVFERHVNEWRKGPVKISPSLLQFQLVSTKFSSCKN